MQAFLLSVSLLILAFTFSLSLRGKLKTFGSFVQTVQGLTGLPKPADEAVSIAVLMLEAAAIISLIAYPPIGFSLSLALLLVFTAALIWMITKQGRAACNCFGVKKIASTWTDVLRNIFLISVAATGLAIAKSGSSNLSSLSVQEFAASILVASALLVFVLNLKRLQTALLMHKPLKELA